MINIHLAIPVRQEDGILIAWKEVSCHCLLFGLGSLPLVLLPVKPLILGRLTLNDEIGAVWFPKGKDVGHTNIKHVKSTSNC